MELDQSKDATIIQEAKQNPSIPTKEIEMNINLSILSISKRCLELYLSWRLIDESKMEVDSIIWFSLLILNFSYNIIMATAIIFSYNDCFKDHSKLIKNILIILSLIDLDSALPLVSHCKKGMQKSKMIQIIHEKMVFICKLSVLQMCSLCYLTGQGSRDINLDEIFLFLVYSFILFLKFKTLSEQLRILLIFYIGGMIKVEFFLPCQNLTCTLLFNESLVVIILLVISLIAMIKQKNFKSAFASRFMVKESLRLIFIKPNVLIKGFDYINSPSIPSLIKLYIFKTKFKHIGYIWRIIECIVLPSYFLSQRDQLLDKVQVLRISSTETLGNFHYILNLTLCSLLFMNAIYLFFRVIKIIKFIPVLSDQIINELEQIQRNEICSRKEDNYIWQPSNLTDYSIYKQQHKNTRQKGNSEFYFQSTYMKRYEFLQKESLSQKKTSDLEMCREFKKINTNLTQSDEKINQVIENNNNKKIDMDANVNDNQQNNILKHYQNRSMNVKHKFNTIKLPNNERTKRIKKFNSYNDNIQLDVFSNPSNKLKQRQKKNIEFVQLRQEFQSNQSSQIQRDLFQQNDIAFQTPTLSDQAMTLGTKAFNSPLQADYFSILQKNTQGEGILEKGGNEFQTESSQFKQQSQQNKCEELKTEFTTQHITSPSHVVLLQLSQNDYSRKNNNILYTNGDDSIVEIKRLK